MKEKITRWAEKHPIGVMIAADLFIVAATPFITMGVIKTQTYLWDKYIYKG